MSRPLNPSQRHAHSVSLGASNSNNRVTRRKSVTTTAAQAAAAVAASMEGGESTSLPMGAHRRSLAGRKGQESGSVGNVSGFSSYLSRSINSPSQDQPVRKESPGSDHSDSKLKNRNRRASEGAQLKIDGKRAAAAIKCDRCGKGYKHGSCLSKHMCVSPLPLGRLPFIRSGICTMSALCRSPSWSFNFPFATISPSLYS